MSMKNLLEALLTNTPPAWDPLGTKNLEYIANPELKAIGLKAFSILVEKVCLAENRYPTESLIPPFVQDAPEYKERHSLEDFRKLFLGAPRYTAAEELRIILENGPASGIIVP